LLGKDRKCGLLFDGQVRSRAGTKLIMHANTSARKGDRNCQLRAWRKWAIAVAALAALAALFAVFDVRALMRHALDWIEGLGPWGPVLFVLLYIAATVLFIPGSALTLGAGAIFGVAKGSLLVSLASTLAAAAAFLVGRHFARVRVAKKIEGNATFAAVDRAVAEQGWKIVLLTRLSPAFPFSLLNYALGLTQVKFRDYIIASWIGMMPGTIMYVHVGSLAHAGASGQPRTPAQWALYGVGLLATIAVTVIITRTARRALAKQTSVKPSPA
jgi:uncharacterized membrane protein YdjX (TVP38/TMEM64 family)